MQDTNCCFFFLERERTFTHVCKLGWGGVRGSGAEGGGESES